MVDKRLKREWKKTGISLNPFIYEDILRTCEIGLYALPIDLIREAIKEKIDKLIAEGKLIKKIRPIR